MRQYFELPRAIYIICLGMFINRAGSFVVPFLTLYLSQQLQLGDLFATRTMGLFGLGSLGGALLGGYLADHVGRRPVMLTALFGGAATMLLLSRLSSGPAIMVGVVLLALISDLYRPAAQAMMADLVPPLQRPYSFTLIYVAINLGFAVGPAVAGTLLKHTSFTALFIGDAATTLTYGVMVVFLLGETMQMARSGSTATGNPAPVSAPAARVGGHWHDWARIFHDGKFMMLCLASLLISLVYMQAMSTFPLYARNHGVSPDVFGRILAINGLMIAVLQIPFSHFLQRFDRRVLLPLAACLTALGFGLKAGAGSAPAFAGCVIIWTIGEMIQVPLTSPMIAAIAPADLRARYMGVFSVSFSGANMVAAPLGGLVLTTWGGAALWLIAAGTAVLAAICFAVACARLGPTPGKIGSTT